MYLSADSVKRLKSAFGNKSICAMALFLIPNWRFLSSEVSESSSIFIYLNPSPRKVVRFLFYLNPRSRKAVRFLFYLNPRPRKVVRFLFFFHPSPRIAFCVNYFHIRGLGLYFSLINFTSEASDELFFFILPQSETSDEQLFPPKRLSDPLRYAEKEKQRKGDGYINLIVTFAV